jgi:hypothetical protein
MSTLTTQVSESLTPTADEARVALVQALAGVMARENLEDAALAYKLAGLTIKELEDVKTAALGMAEQIMRASGETHARTVVGTLGWTAPAPSTKVDAKALLGAAANDQALMVAIAPYVHVEIPAARFYIK